MAAIVRNQHELLSLRISRAVSRSRNDLLLELWRGSAKLAEHSEGVEAIGLPPRATYDALSRARFAAGPALVAWIKHGYWNHLAVDREPLWLEIRRSSADLAIVPWEEVLYDAVDGPILYLPNFVVPPRFPAGQRIRLALCASSPLAKASFEIAPYLADLTRQLQQSGIPQSETHVFADVASLAEVERMLPRSADHEVVVHEPARMSSFERRPSLRGESLEDQPVRSPWLSWMLEELKEHPTDLVHFACPGYFSDNRGALALARSPTRNDDANWSHFVGAQELTTFLNMAGALSVGFSHPIHDVWGYGLRLLADQIAYLRPGPVIVHRDVCTDHPTGDAYGFLFAPSPRPPPRDRHLSIYCHPQRVQADASVHAGDDARPSPAFPGSAPGTSLGFAPQPQPRNRGASVSRAQAPEAAPDPAWKRAMQLAVDQAIVAVRSDGAAARHVDAVKAAADDALNLLKDLWGGEK